MNRIRVIISLFVFVILFGLAWALDSRIQEQPLSPYASVAGDGSITIYSSHGYKPVVDPITPYGPREYVRIIHIDNPEHSNDEAIQPTNESFP